MWPAEHGAQKRLGRVGLEQHSRPLLVVPTQCHGGAALCPSQDRHDDQGGACDDQTDRAGAGTVNPDNGDGGIHHHVAS